MEALVRMWTIYWHLTLRLWSFKTYYTQSVAHTICLRLSEWHNSSFRDRPEPCCPTTKVWLVVADVRFLLLPAQTPWYCATLDTAPTLLPPWCLTKLCLCLVDTEINESCAPLKKYSHNGSFLVTYWLPLWITYSQSLFHSNSFNRWNPYYWE